MERIDELKKQIKEARKAYELGTPIMSDREYDAIEHELRMLAPRCRLLKKVGGKRGTVELLNPMLSLTKAQSVEDLPVWTRRAVRTLKIDGIALRLVIRNGQIVLACMRGNGFVGTDCTAQAQHLGLLIDADFSGDVRGELYQDVDTWKSWTNRPQTSRNNAVRAMMGNPTAVPFYGLHFAAYDMVGAGCSTFTEKLAKLSSAGFEVAPIVSDDVRPVETIDQTPIVEVAGKLYPADGIVYRMDSERDFERAGHDEFSPFGAIAIKWDVLPVVETSVTTEDSSDVELFVKKIFTNFGLCGIHLTSTATEPRRQTKRRQQWQAIVTKKSNHNSKTSTSYALRRKTRSKWSANATCSYGLTLAV